MCGIAGAYNVPNAGYVVHLMLKAMQHRGQEAAGIATFDGADLFEKRGFGLVDEVFGKCQITKKLPGTMAIGHVRYSTTGDTRNRESIQPLSAHFRDGYAAIVHNGNLTNYAVMKARLEAEGAIFQSKSDTELFLHLLARTNGRGMTGRLERVFAQVEGAYSIIMLGREGFYAAVDPYGWRPLSYARFGDGYLFASETCAFDLFGDLRVTAVQPGTIVEGVEKPPAVASSSFARAAYERRCSFEHIYFTRPDSTIFGASANAIREKLGIALAKTKPVKSDLVMPVPDSSNTVALMFAETLGIPFRFSLIRNHYMGRTFITPEQQARELGVRLKLNPVRDAVAGKSVTVVDDSLVRGTTMKKVAALLRDAGAREVHLRIASPPILHPCFWGIDTPERKQLKAAALSMPELIRWLGADSLEYLSIEELRAALGDPDGIRYCVSCFSGERPVKEHELPAS